MGLALAVNSEQTLGTTKQQKISLEARGAALSIGTKLVEPTIASSSVRLSYYYYY